jgi:hypothetical protein
MSDDLPQTTAKPARLLPVRLIIAQAVAVALLIVWTVVLGRPLGLESEWCIRVRPWIYPLKFLAPPLITLVGFGGLVWYLWKALRREKIARHRRGLAWTIALTLMIGAWCMQVALWTMVPAYVVELAAIQFSNVSTGYLEEAHRIDDLGRYLREYAADMPSKAEHVATHPPGAALFFYAVRRAGEIVPGLNEWALTTATVGSGMNLAQVRAEILAYPGPTWKGAHAVATAVIASYLLGALGCLMVVIVFAATRRSLGDERALVAAAMMALVPSLLLFFPLLDQLIAFLGALMLAALAGTQRHWAWGLAAGLAAAAAMFVSLGALALVAIGGVFLLLRATLIRGGQADLSWAGRFGGFAALAAFVIGWIAGLASWGIIGVDTLGVIATGLGEHSGIAGASSFRSWHIWVWMNLIEFAVFLGLPLAVCVVASVPGVIRDLRARSAQALPAYLAAAGLLTLLVLDVSGIVRGETSRIWLFFAPFLAPAAARVLLADDGDIRPFVIAVALTALQLLVMGYTMQPIIRPY